MQIFVSALFGVIALCNLIQVIVGRQLVGRSPSRRTGGPLRWQSAATAIVGAGGMVMAVDKGWGFALLLLGFLAQELVRRSAPQQ
ncbi:hypothetical protein ABZ636_39955 [Streptomyces sp. NPDC007251]|uniref:hypothetical protein n=1 Tax=unclassified Streptomyces TaxID=2593676 RepID=UPI0033EEE149